MYRNVLLLLVNFTRIHCILKFIKFNYYIWLNYYLILCIGLKKLYYYYIYPHFLIQ